MTDPLKSPAPGRDTPPEATPAQPVLILGGFLITAEAYAPMVDTLSRLTGQPVRLVPVSRLEWLLTVFPFAWARILDRVATQAQALADASPTGRITLVGHSSGGIMLRLFLSDLPFQGRRYGGRQWADRLICLGSPHTALKATPLRALVDRELPGAFFRDNVRYVSVAGAVNLDPAAGEASDTARRLAPTAYRNSTGNPNDRGDGLVPVEGALLKGSRPIVVEGVAHGGAFGPRWYGSPEVVERWWSLQDPATAKADAGPDGPTEDGAL
ncbi:MAG: esterase/lipase family protein [Cyanobacteriota bacterium]